MARVAHAIAMESPRVVADVVAVQEFPHLARRYRVMGVPKTVINEKVVFTGAMDEGTLVQRVLQAVGPGEEDGEGGETVGEQTTPFV